MNIITISRYSCLAMVCLLLGLSADLALAVKDATKPAPGNGQQELAGDSVNFYDTTSGRPVGQVPVKGLEQAFPASNRNIVRYDSPTIAGFTSSASWGQNKDEYGDAARRYAEQFLDSGITAGVQYATGNDSGYFAPDEPVSGIRHTPTGLFINWYDTDRLFVFPVSSKVGRQNLTFYNSFYLNQGDSSAETSALKNVFANVSFNWAPSVGWNPGPIEFNFIGDAIKLESNKMGWKGMLNYDSWGTDYIRVGVDYDLSEFNINGSANYKFTDADIGDATYYNFKWNKFFGVLDTHFYQSVDFSYRCDTDKLTEKQDAALTPYTAVPGLTVDKTTYKIGDFCAGSVGFSFAPTPGVDMSTAGMGNDWILQFGVTFGEFTFSTPRIVTASAGSQGKSVADPPAKNQRLPNDGFFHSQGSWGQEYDDQWGLKRIGFEAAGRDGKGSLWPRQGQSVVVAVVDTGIDFGHPELYGTLWANIKDDPNNDKDDDNNRYRNDFLGWNFVNNGNHTFDDNGHGTFVAGIIAARTDNGLGMAGINPWARIMPVKVADRFGDSNDVDVAQGIAYAAHMGAKVINVSIAGRKLSKIEQAAVDEAVEHGALVIVAAGNDGEDLQDISPAGLNGVITVAATDHQDQRTKYSNWGGKVDIAAPGEEILSLRAIQTDLLQFFDKDYQRGANIMGTQRHYYRLSGTSFAAPFVAGVASLMLSLRPELTPAQVKRMLLQSAKDIDVAGVDQFTGYGLLDAAAALQADPEFFVEAAITGVGVVQVDGKPHLRITGRADADQFKSAWIEIGPGDKPTEWKRVADGVNKAAKPSTLADVSAAHFTGRKQWVIKIISEHENGRKREARFILKVG